MIKNYSISATVETVTITGITDEPFNIDIKGDVVLTPFVEELTKQIDVGNTFEMEACTEGLNDKQKLVADTICQIIDAYNGCLTQEEPNQESLVSDIPNEEDSTSETPDFPF